MNFKGLVQRELGEGLTEEELASAVGVPVWNIAHILADELPHDPASWERFARYFRTHADFLQFGDPPHTEGLFELTESTYSSPLGPMRKVPLLRWDQIDQMVKSKKPPRLIHADALLETDIPGRRTFALQVIDNSMHPLFSEGEIIFVDPDLPSGPGDYVVVESEDGHSEGALLRQLKEIDGQIILYPLNRRYAALPPDETTAYLGPSRAVKEESLRPRVIVKSADRFVAPNRPMPVTSYGPKPDSRFIKMMASDRFIQYPSQ